MPIQIKPFTETWLDGVRELDKRLMAGGYLSATRVPHNHVSHWLPKTGDRRIFQEYFVAVEGTSVRGVYSLKHQEISLGGRVVPAGNCLEPISEGTVNRIYSPVAIQLLKDALGKLPLLFAAGMGDYELPWPRILKAMGWTMWTVPFYFKVKRGGRFLRNIKTLRKSRLKAMLLDIAAVSGVGWAGAVLASAVLTKNGPAFSVEIVERFSSWADELWNLCKDQYSMIAVRDSEVLNILYPADSKRFIRLRVWEPARTIGWALVLDTMMSNHKHFGNMRVGSIVDCLALPEDAGKVIRAATEVLERRGVDLIVSNQSHPSWCSGLRDAGFVKGPSNFIFAASKQLAELLLTSDPGRTGIHINRGDGDGPIHL